MLAAHHVVLGPGSSSVLGQPDRNSHDTGLLLDTRLLRLLRDPRRHGLLFLWQSHRGSCIRPGHVLLPPTGSQSRSLDYAASGCTVLLSSVWIFHPGRYPQVADHLLGHLCAGMLHPLIVCPLSGRDLVSSRHRPGVSARTRKSDATHLGDLAAAIDAWLLHEAKAVLVSTICHSGEAGSHTCHVILVRLTKKTEIG